MLCAGSGFHVLSVSLQALYKRDTQCARQIRVFSVGFLPASPSGIAENIDIGRPEGQSFVNVPIAKRAVSVVLRAPFCRDHISDPAHQRLVKSRSHADRLREARCRTRSGYAMQAFIPPVVSRDPKSCNFRGIISQLTHLLRDGHLRYQLFGTLSRLLSVHVLTSFAGQSASVVIFVPRPGAVRLIRKNQISP